jgi:UDP-N-acetylmuramoyl-L-alanyl-D-glutamate--2,6-diaminopimelate ligase
MQHAVSGDVVLVAGKGHETVQLIGTRAIPFSDRERVMQLARDRA